MKKLWLTLLAVVSCLCLCFGLAACGGDENGGNGSETGEGAHTHVAEHFQVDDNGHWKICTECGEKFSVGDHKYNSDNACEACGYSTVYTKGLEYAFYKETDTYTVTGLGEAEGTTDLIIPAYYEGKAVTSIGEWAFMFCSGLTSIVIPDSVTSIGEHAFEGCEGLTSIVIPDSVSSIGQSAFYDTAYYNDASHWDASEVLYIGNHLIKANDTISSAYAVRQGTKTIADTAFVRCIELTSISISDSVVSIGKSAFAGCSGLTSITIPDSVTSIGLFAFAGCSGLTSITIPDSVTEIEERAFSNTAYYNDESNWDASGVLYIGNHLIEAKETISGVYSVRQGTKTIADIAFRDRIGMTSITIPDSVTSIGKSAFEFCDGLTGELKIPDSVTSIGEWAFEFCDGLTGELKIPDSVTSIGSATFAGCSGFEGISVSSGNKVYRSEQNCLIEKRTNILIAGCKNSVIPNGVTAVGNYAFRGCSGLTGITIPDSVTSIEFEAFDGCSGLTSVTIGDGVTSIGGYAFYGCSGLTSVTIGDGVISIGTDAFENCSELTEIHIADLAAWCKIDFKDINANPLCYAGHLYLDGKEVTKLKIPAEITEVKDYAFNGCGGLTSVEIPDSVTSIGEWAFSDCSDLTSVEIPDSVTEIGYCAFANCSGLTSITIPDSVTEIESSPFKDCSGLKEVHISSLSAWCKIDFLNFYDNPLYYAHHLYLDGEEVTELKIPAGITKVKDYAFEGCSGLTSIEIPDSVTSIGENAFSGCSGLTSVEIPDSVTEIGYCAFEDCSGLKSVTIGEGVTSIVPLAFHGCNELTSVTIGSNVTSIGERAFDGCEGLTSIAIPDNVTWIGESAFYKCWWLMDIQFEGTVEAWQAVEKEFDSSWDFYIGNYTVTCTDGTVARDGTVTYFEEQ